MPATTLQLRRVRHSSSGLDHKGSSLPDEEIIMLGLYEWLHEEIELENAARREENAS